MNTLRIKLQQLLVRGHREERGAIMLLMLAAFLIVMMTALVIYDTGQSARDKMDAQIAADTAAWSQAAIKSRSMNMIAYANVAKRTFYAFNTMYAAAYLGMIEATAAYAASCNPFNLVACAKAVQGGIYVAAEAVEFANTNMWTLGAPFGTSYRNESSKREVDMLNAYQAYINAVAPWWGWSEALTRGARNGGTFTASWPPPPGNLASVISFATNLAQIVDFFAGTTFYNLYPAHRSTDELPIRHEGASNRSRVIKVGSHVSLCASTALSTEYAWMWGEHIARSSGFARDGQAILFGILSTPLGCLAAGLTLGDEVLPWTIKTTLTVTPTSAGDPLTADNWLEATSNVVIGYKMDPDRFSDDGGDRQKFGFVNRDYVDGPAPILKHGGYFATTRSEIVYQGGLLSSAAGAIQTGAPGALSSVFGVVRDLFDEPNMWAARWTARMRPVQLNGEQLKSPSGMFFDMLPYIILSAPIAYANSPTEFSLAGARNFGQAAMLDLAFLQLAMAGLSDDNNHARGFVK